MCSWLWLESYSRVRHCDHQYPVVHKSGKECGSWKSNTRKMIAWLVKNFTTSYFCRGQQFLEEFCLHSERHCLKWYFGAFLGERVVAKRFFLGTGPMLEARSKVLSILRNSVLIIFFFLAAHTGFVILFLRSITILVDHWQKRGATIARSLDLRLKPYWDSVLCDRKEYLSVPIIKYSS